MHRLLLWSVLTCMLAVMPANAERILSKRVAVDAPLTEVWRAWTTPEGLRFISGKSRIELKRGGAYEWFLDLEPDAHGLSGSETSHLLAVLPGDLLAFNWNFPPDVPSLRANRAMTQVVVRFTELSPQRTEVRLDVGGWQEGADWGAGYRYFDRAWGVVLEALRTHYAGP